MENAQNKQTNLKKLDEYMKVVINMYHRSKIIPLRVKNGLEVLILDVTSKSANGYYETICSSIEGIGFKLNTISFEDEISNIKLDLITHSKERKVYIDKLAKKLNEKLKKRLRVECEYHVVLAKK